jgi:hypothetical protein
MSVSWIDLKASISSLTYRKRPDCSWNISSCSSCLSLDSKLFWLSSKLVSASEWAMWSLVCCFSTLQNESILRLVKSMKFDVSLKSIFSCRASPRTDSIWSLRSKSPYLTSRRTRARISSTRSSYVLNCALIPLMRPLRYSILSSKRFIEFSKSCSRFSHSNLMA